MHLVGMDVHDNMKVTGHSSPAMLKKYIRADQLDVVTMPTDKYDYLIRLVFHARHRQAGCKDKQGCDSFHRFVIIYNRYSYAREEVGGTSYL